MKNRMFGDDEPENPSPRTTIVGGRPPESAGAPPPVPTGLQRLLRLASVDEGFQAQLLQQRADFAEAAGVELSASERAVLNAASPEQLSQMIGCLPPPPTDRRTFLKEAALAALALVAAPALSGCKPGDAAAEAPPRPDRPMATRGIRPIDRPLLDDPDAGARVERPEMHTKGGIAPDPVPERPLHNDMLSEGGIAPHVPEERPETATPDAGPQPVRPTRPQPNRGIVVDPDRKR